MGTPNLVLGGLGLGQVDPVTGVEFTTSVFDGWGGTSSTIDPKPKTRAHGAWAGNAYFAARNMLAGGLMIAPSESALDAAIDRLNDACGLDDTLLTVNEARSPRWCMARRSDVVLAPKQTDTIAKWSIQVVAADPRKFSAPITRSTSLPSSSGGTSFPVLFPMSFTATTVSGQVSIFNSGNETGPVVMRLNGPLNGPIITHVGSGLRLVFAVSAVIGAGEYWDVDCEGQTVMAQGQSSRANWITSRQWPGFEPGNNTFALSAASFTTGTLDVTGIPADK